MSSFRALHAHIYQPLSLKFGRPLEQNLDLIIDLCNIQTPYKNLASVLRNLNKDKSLFKIAFYFHFTCINIHNIIPVCRKAVKIKFDIDECFHIKSNMITKVFLIHPY